MQSEELACLPVGSEVSAKYKGAFCEAKVKKVHRQVKCRITFKLGLGSFTLCDTLIKGNIAVGSNILAKHPDKPGYLDAVVNKVQDQSHYTVVFDDGDIATLRRNALCMKSGKHFNASESLDNLPLTHPEHFGTPVGSRRRGRMVEEEEEEEASSEDEETNQPYVGNIGRVVCVEVTDKKMARAKENWFPGLVVAPNAQEIVKINTKEDFLVRSFKDHRFYTVPKKECKKFHRDSVKSSADPAHTKAVEHATSFLDKDELPVHWDREVLFDMREEVSTEGSSEEDMTESGDEDNESTEEKDHLVAELYKHMDDRGTPINRTPSIGACDVDLYKLFKIVQRLGGQNRVTANNQWRQVAKKLGFETNWCANQVRVCYARYLHSFEEMYRTLGCTFINYPKNPSLRVRHGSGRPLVRGARIKSRDAEDGEEGAGSPGLGGGKERGEESSDQSSTTSQEDILGKQQGYGSDTATPVAGPSTRTRESNLGRGRRKGWRKNMSASSTPEASTPPPRGGSSGGGVDMLDVDDLGMELETEIVERVGKPGRKSAGSISSTTKSNVFSRTRRDSSSSLSTASDVRTRKDDLTKDKPEKGIKKVKDDEDKRSTSKGRREDIDKKEDSEKKKKGEDSMGEKSKGKKEENEKIKGRGNKNLAAEDIEKKIEEIERKEEEEEEGRGRRFKEEDEGKGKKVKDEEDVKGKRYKELDEEKGRRYKELDEDRGRKYKELDDEKGRRMKEEDDSDSSVKPTNRAARNKGRSKLIAEEEDENTSDMDALLPKDKSDQDKKKLLKRKVSKSSGGPGSLVGEGPAPTPGSMGAGVAPGGGISGSGLKKVSARDGVDEPQHLKNNVICNIGDKIKVFWLHGQIYEAKILKVTHPEGQRWPKFYVHYLGWNSRYDEWITRARISHNESWKEGKGGKSAAGSSNINPVPAGCGSSTASESSPVGSMSSTESPNNKTSSLTQPKSLKGKISMGKVKEESKSDDDTEESDIKSKDELDKVKKEDTPMKKKRMIKGKLTTPTSTPDSSRTSSPASTRAARSPTKQVSPSKDTDEHEESDDRSSAQTRTASPVTRADSAAAANLRTESPVTRKLKRQSSNAGQASEKLVKGKSGATKKDDEIDADEVEKDDKVKKESVKDSVEESLEKRKSSRSGAAAREESSRSGAVAREESGRSGAAARRPNTPDDKETKLIEVKKETTKPVISSTNSDNPRTSARLESKRPVTPVSEAKRPTTPSKRLVAIKDEDPYDFKEIEEATLKFEPTLKSTDSPTRAARIKEEAKREAAPPKLPLSLDDDKSATVSADKSSVDVVGSKSETPTKASATDSKGTPSKDITKLPASRGGRKKKADDTTSTDDTTTVTDRKKKVDESTSEDDKSADIKKEEDRITSPKVDVKKENIADKIKIEESFTSKTKESPQSSLGSQPMVALQRIPCTTSPSRSKTTSPPTTAPPLMKPMTVGPNRFALFPHLASLATGGMIRPLPTVAPPLPPSTIQPLPTMAPTLPPAAPPLQLSSSITSETARFLSPSLSTATSTTTSTASLSLLPLPTLITNTSSVSSIGSSSAMTTSILSTLTATTSSMSMMSTSVGSLSASGSSTPLSTSSVIDAIVGNILQSHQEQEIKKEKEESETKPLVASILKLSSSINTDKTVLPLSNTSPSTKQQKKDVVKAEIKEETESDGDDTKNNSDSDDASGGGKKSPGRLGEKRLSSLDTGSAVGGNASGVSPRKTRKRQKIRGPRNYNLKSREVVSDTDSDSSEAAGENAAKQRPLPPKRRKTVESVERRKAAAQQQESAAKMTEDSDLDKSLVCREIIERSPEIVTPGGTPQYSGNKSPEESSELDLESLTGSPKRVGSDFESLIAATRSNRSGSANGGAVGGAGSDVESVTGSSRRAGSVDSRGGMDSSSDTRSGRGKRKRGGAGSNMDISPSDLKKRRSRDSVGRGRGKGSRGGRVSGSNSNIRARQEADEGSETGGGGGGVSLTPSIMGTRSRTDFEMTKLVRLDNAALEALAQPKPNTVSKYNFYVKLEPGMDSGSRISLLQDSLEDLRKTYLSIKSELSALERRRKKIRKKKEQRSNTAEISATT